MLNSIKTKFPNENFIYFGDTAHLPYGSKSKETIKIYSEKIVNFLIKKNTKLIVIACNTASSLAAKYLIKKGFLDNPPLFQVCLGIRWAAEANTSSFKAMVDALPDGCNWGGFGIGAMEMPMVAQAVLLGGNVRVGLEDNLYLEKGVFVSNAQLVERACNIVQLMGCSIQTPAEARQTLGLRKTL